jgi:hypothetical protein
MSLRTIARSLRLSSTLTSGERAEACGYGILFFVLMIAPFFQCFRIFDWSSTVCTSIVMGFPVRLSFIYDQKAGAERGPVLAIDRTIDADVSTDVVVLRNVL